MHCLRALQRGAMQRIGAALRAQQVGGAQLHTSGAQGLRCRHALGIGDAAGGDHRYVQRGDQLRQQGEGAELGGQVLAEEDAAVAAGLQALGDHQVDAVLLQPEAFGDRCRAGGDLRAGGAGALQQVGARQAEVEADQCGPVPLQHRGHCRVERLAGGAGRNVGWVDVEFGEQRCEHPVPGVEGRRVGCWRLVTEEIDVVGSVGQRLDGGQLGVQRCRIEHAGRDRTQPAGLAHRRGQQVILRTGHGCLDDRVLDAEEIAQVHGAAPFSRRGAPL